MTKKQDLQLSISKKTKQIQLLNIFLWSMQKFQEKKERNNEDKNLDDLEKSFNNI